ncbi:toll/interleukin-1 receptor domain-containing protein [Amycolatopsis magusensis]|uniref:toll/interleukin-1 receptor domain-containing protein n=1 Tax=Amycolatopsis magusensis TaxID=882444 RepID=UPI0024A97A35|nr:toll/interleukin-1 receptor domain-containing protein [Amycolatopsis magusensis]MDI5982535.1 toll/interleukin-1 receptor domain-containing protein [Amycolatopsis magusensis]
MIAATKADFFISYNSTDSSWAEWIAWTLEQAGYTTLIQQWDFRPGSNFAIEMQHALERAERVIAVLSEDYLAADFTQPEWAAAFAVDPVGLQRTLIPIMVRSCQPPALLNAIIHIKLYGMDEELASKKLLNGVFHKRAKPTDKPSFPGASS